MASRAVASKAPSWLAPFKKWAYNVSGFNKYGLHHDDCLAEDTVVKEALRRLPEPLVQARNFRIIRAMQLELAHEILPKDQWTKYEEDVRYLKPYLEEVRREMEEKAEWEKNN